MSPEPEPQYCTKCGRKLIEKEMLKGYNKYTGKGEIFLVKTCPRFIEVHDTYEIKFLKFD